MCPGLPKRTSLKKMVLNQNLIDHFLSLPNYVCGESDTVRTNQLIVFRGALRMFSYSQSKLKNEVSCTENVNMTVWNKNNEKNAFYLVPGNRDAFSEVLAWFLYELRNK